MADFEDPIEVQSYDLWLMFQSTLDYSLGRSTYMPSECTRLYKRYHRNWTRAQREWTAHRIESFLKMVDTDAMVICHNMDYENWHELQQYAKRTIDNV